MNTDKKTTKQQRLMQKQKQELKRKNLKRLGWITGILAICASILFIIIEKQKPLPGRAVKIMEDQSHIQEISSPHTPYNSDPPTSGQHVEYITDWGVHEEEVPKEVLVHNLEDGGVVIYYNKNVTKSTKLKLKELVESYEDRVVLAPYPNMKNDITLTTWGRMDKLKDFDVKRINRFIEAFRGIDHH